MPNTTPRQLQEQAQRAAAADQYWDAVEQYTQILGQIGPQTAVDADKEIRLQALRERGRLLALLGEQNAALAAFEQYYLESGSSVHAADALVAIGSAQRGLGQYRQALQAYQEALDISEALNHTPGRSKALAGSGGTFLLMGRMHEATANLAKAAALFEQLGDAIGQIRTLNKQGIAHALSGELEAAILTFQTAIDLAKIHGRLENQVSALNNLGECYQQLFALEQAINFHQQALTLAVETDLRILESDLRRNLGLDLVLQGNLDAGLPYLQQALAISKDTEDLDLRLNTLYNLALTELQRNNIGITRPLIEELHQRASQHNLRSHLANAYHLQGLLAKKEGDIQSAQELWQQALFLGHETNKRMLLWQIHAELAEIADNISLAAVHNRIAHEVIQQIAEPITDKDLRQTFLSAPPIKAILEKELI